MSSDDQFVHLHTHSDNSLLDGANKIDDLIQRAQHFDMPALALTDHGVMFGAWEFQEKAKKAGIKPIIGMEAYVAPGDRRDRETRSPTGKPYYHLVLLAQNKTGYENLIKLSSLGFKEGFYYNPRIDRELMEEYNEGIICTSACLAGEVAQNLRQGREEAAREAIEWHANVFRDRYYLEVQAHDTEGQAEVNRQILRLGNEMGLPVVATNDAHFLTADDHEAHDVLICVGMNKDRDDPNRLRYDDGLYFKSAKEIRQHFPDHPEVLQNTVDIAERTGISFEKQYHVPEFPVPDDRKTELERRLEEKEEVDADEEEQQRQALEAELLKDLAWEGARERYGTPLSEEVEERLEYELSVITETGYSGYFLITQDFINWAKERGISVGPGRGSAAGSLICYSLGITDVDPLEYDLLFERFLNPDRVSMPDIDIDFDPENRERVIDYVRQKYGEEAVCQIITFGTMKARAAIRDVGRVLDWELGEVDKLAKLVPNDPGNALTIEEAIEQVGKVRRLYNNEPRYRKLLDYAGKLEGLRRHSSIHAAGVIIAPGELTEYVPVAVEWEGNSADSEGTVVSQYDMNALEKAGMLKMDFLGLKTLTVIGQAKEMAEQNHDVEIDFDEVDLDDPKTFERIRAGETAGIFQFESSLATEKLMDMEANSFDDLVAANALLRPGPLDSGMTDEYIQRKLGHKPVKYPHPELEEILEPTYGIMVYQEQIMQVAQQLADYTLAEADVLRKAVGKKDEDLIQKTLTKFVRRCQEHGVSEEKAEELAALIETFGRYGFNRAHSAAYSMISFRTAYLKAHYPHEFMAALLTSEIGDTDKIVEYMNEARQMDIDVLAPDVRTSGYRFTVVEDQEGEEHVRFGLGAIRNVGESVIQSILEARQEKAFEDFFDFVERSGEKMNSRVLEALINAGALDEFAQNRAQMLAAADQALGEAQRRRKEKESGQINMFMGGGEGDQTQEGNGFDLELPDISAMGNRERLGKEKEALGLYVSGHPLEGREEIAGALASHQANEIREETPQSTSQVAGVLTSVDRAISGKGNEYARVTLEDLTGSIEMLVFSDTLKKCDQMGDEEGSLLREGNLVVVEGNFKDDDREGQAIMFANEFQTFERAIQEGRLGVKMELEKEKLQDRSSMERVQQLCKKYSGTSPIFVEVIAPNGEGGLQAAQSKIRPTPELLEELREMFGADKVQLIQNPQAPSPARSRRGRPGGRR